MEDFEQENEELREEINTLKGTVERLNGMIEALVVAQNRPTPEEPQRTVVSEIVSTPILSMPCRLIDLGACRITLFQKGTYLQLLKLQRSPWICVHRRVTNLWKLKFQEQRRWVSHNRMLRYQDLLSWLLHDRLCILFPRREGKYIITLQVRMLACLKDWTSSRNNFCECRRNSRLSEDKIYLERMLQTSVWFQMLRFLINSKYQSSRSTKGIHAHKVIL